MNKFIVLLFTTLVFSACGPASILSTPTPHPSSSYSPVPSTNLQGSGAVNLPSTNQALADRTLPVPKGSFYLPILMYHQIKNPLKPNPYIVAPAMFDQQMHWLQQNGYHTIHYDDFYQVLVNHHTFDPKSVVITFDDGFRNQYDNAFPILKKYGMTGIFFVYTNTIDTKGGMTWIMLADLLKNNMEIGSHTVSHADLAKLSVSQVNFELSYSKKLLESKLATPINYFAYPGGSYNALTVNTLKNLGYISATTTNHDVFHPLNENPYLVRRIHIDNDMDSFVKFVTGVKKS